MAAFQGVAEIDVLFYVLPEVDISPAAVTQMQSFFCNHWQANVHLFPCQIFTQDQTLPKWQRQGRGIFNFFQHPDYAVTSGPQQIQALEDCLGRQPDAIFLHRLRSACPVLLTDHALPPLFLDLDDIEPVAFVRKLSQPPSQPIASLPYYLQVPALWWGTAEAIRRCQQTYVCSDQDRSYLTDFWHLPRVVTVPNSAAIPQTPPLSTDPALLLIGSYSYAPNLNAANFLIKRVWPRIRQARPEARLIIAGRDPSKICGYNTGVPGVEFTGFVDDLSALYRRVRIVCCPIFSGGGTRVKMIEAAAHGKPVVASKIGVEGLSFQAGTEYLEANDAQTFAEACLTLLENQTLCEQIGLSAREKAIQYYDRSHIVQLIRSNMNSKLVN